MNTSRLMIRTLPILASALGLAVTVGCARSLEVIERSGEVPAWVQSSRETTLVTRNGKPVLLMRAMRDRARDLSLAKREARYELAKAIATQVDEEVETLFQSVQESSGNSIDQPETARSLIRDAVRAQASTRLTSLVVEEVYWERRLYRSAAGEEEGYRVYVLGSIPEATLKELKATGYRKAQEAARASGDRAAERLLDEQLMQLQSKTSP